MVLWRAPSRRFGEVFSVLISRRPADRSSFKKCTDQHKLEFNRFTETVLLREDVARTMASQLRKPRGRLNERLSKKQLFVKTIGRVGQRSRSTTITSFELFCQVEKSVFDKSAISPQPMIVGRESINADDLIEPLLNALILTEHT